MSRSHSSLLLSFLCLLSFVASPSHGSRSIDWSELDRTALEELKSRNTPGAAIAVIRDGRVAYTKGYGVASVESGAPVTPEMLFRLGSTTKMMTAASLVSLALKGKLKLDAPIGEIVKGLDPAIAAVTPHQLLSQSAGIRDFAATLISNDEDALGRQIKTWKSDIFFTGPGKIYSYSSPGYWLAGFVAEQAGGKLYADVMEQEVFKPLGMTRSTLRPLVAMTYPCAVGHRVDGRSGPVVIRPAFNNTAMWPGGSVYSNVQDLVRFAIALMDHGKVDGAQAIPAAVVEALSIPRILLPGSADVYYAYGLMSYSHRGVPVITHGGASTGYGSTILIAPEQRFAVIIITNKSGEALYQTREKAMEMILPLKASEQEPSPTFPPLTSAEINTLSGVYLHAPQKWEIFSVAGQLRIKYENQESDLIRTGASSYRFGAAGDDELVFIQDSEGKSEYLFTGMYAAKKMDAIK